MFEEGKVQPSKDQEPLKRSKATEGKQKRSFTEGSGPEVTLDYHTKVPTWNPPLELDRALLPTDSSIRDFQ